MPKSSFTLEDREIIKEMLGKNISCSRIAEKLNKTKDCVKSEIQRHGKKSNYNIERCFYEEDKLTLVERVKNIEMQIDIILTKLQELMK